MEETKKMNFWKRIKNAVFKLENYGVFLGEKFSTAFKYFLLLVLLITSVIAISETYIFSKMINKGYMYLVDEMPDFSYENGIINFEKNTEAYDDELKFYLFINTEENIADETVQNYKTKTYDGDYGLILLKDKLVYISAGNETEYSYTDMESYYEIDLNNKEDLIEKYDSIGSLSICLVFFIMILLGMYLSNIIMIVSDLILVAVFGYIAARFCRVKIKMLPMMSISIYSLTLPIILSGIYSVLLLFTGFTINYFSIMYLLIAYVYIIAAILMIKSDLIKHNYELSKITEIQKEVRKELEEKDADDKKEEEKKEKDNENKEKPEIDTDMEPDGSEI